MNPLPVSSSGRLRLGLLWMALVACDTGAQLAFKAVAIAIPPQPFWRWVGMLAHAPLVWVGFAFLAATFAVWMAILRTQKLSSAFPVTALAFVTVAIASHVLYGEEIAATTIAGMALIAAGIALLKPLDG